MVIIPCLPAVSPWVTATKPTAGERATHITKLQINQMGFISWSASAQLRIPSLQVWGKCHNQLIMSVTSIRLNNDGMPRMCHPVQIPSFVFGCLLSFTDENTEAQRKTYPNFHKYCRDTDSPRQDFGWRWLANVQDLRLVGSFHACVCVCVCVPLAIQAMLHIVMQCLSCIVCVGFPDVYLSFQS